MGYRRQRARRGVGAPALVLAVIVLSGGIFAWNAGVLQPALSAISERLPQQIGATPTAPPNPPPNAARDVALWPFQSHSPWNTPLATTAQFAGSDAACTRDLADPAYPEYLSTKTWSHAVFIASPSDP